MSESFEALAADHRALLIALLDTPPGAVAERDLAATARRHAPEGLPRPPAELVDRLTDHFLRIVPPNRITWVHPSWRDLVIERLRAAADPRQRFLAHCSIDGSLLALSHGGGVKGERHHPLLVDDADWDTLTHRLYELVPDLADPDLSRLLLSLCDSLDGLPPADPATREVAAVADTVLRRLVTCWTTGDSFASPGLIATWVELAGKLAAIGLPTAPLPSGLRRWVVPVPDRPPIDLGYLDDPQTPMRVPPRNGDHEIVARILADLDNPEGR
jgi:hypothetical protein